MSIWFDKLTEKEKQSILRTKDGWIIRNLFQFGNSLVPNNVIKQYGRKHCEEQLTKWIGENVEIEKSSPDGLGETFIAWKRKKLS